MTFPRFVYSLCQNNVRMRVWRTINASKSSHPQRRFLSCHHTFKGICKAVFMEKSSVNGLNRHLWPGGVLPIPTRRFPSSQGPFPHHQLSDHQIRYFLAEPVQLANEYSVYSSRTAPTFDFACPCVSRRKSGQRDKKTWGTTLSREEVTPMG